MGFDAIVLAGGGARRLDGADKGAVQLGHVTLLQRALETLADAAQVIVVGPASNAALVTELPPDVSFVSEQPPRGGPAAAVSAGLDRVSSDIVVVLACDMPFVRPATINRLLDAVDESDGALLVDEDGRRQYLAAAYQASALRRALDTLDPVANAPVHRAISVLTLVDVEADPDEALDLDTWNDVDRSRRLLEEP